MKTIIFSVSLMLLFAGSIAFGQDLEPDFITLNAGKQDSKATSVSSENLQVFAIRILNVPDLSKYDLVTGNLYFPNDKDVKYAAFYQLSGIEMMNTAENSVKTPGMKYLQYVVTTAVDGKNNGAGFFSIDAYPFELLDIPYLFSKEGNRNKENYVMEFQLTGQMIVSYDEKWVDGVLKKIPVYGNHISLSKKAEITVNTSSSIVPKGGSDKVGSPDDLKSIFGN